MKTSNVLKGLIALTIFISAGLLFNLVASAAEFSAEMIQKMAGQTMTGKIYVKGTKMRMEMNTPSGPVVTIALPDVGKNLMLQPGNKMYMEMSIDASSSIPHMNETDFEKIADKNHLGSEKVNGYDCDKYEIVYHDSSMGKLTQWFSKRLNYPIKMIYKGPQGEVITEYKKIKEGSMKDSLFQVPAEYQKIEIPGM